VRGTRGSCGDMHIRNQSSDALSDPTMRREGRLLVLCGILCLVSSIGAAAPAKIAIREPRIDTRGARHHQLEIPSAAAIAEAALSPQGRAIGAVMAAGCIVKSAGKALGLLRTLTFWGRALPVLLVSERQMTQTHDDNRASGKSRGVTD
jgi:hypothetical protein